MTTLARLHRTLGFYFGDVEMVYTVRADERLFNMLASSVYMCSKLLL